MTASTVRHLALVPDPARSVVAPQPARERWFARRPWWWPSVLRQRLTRIEATAAGACAGVTALTWGTA
jgi:hypothetical protein